jgi:hypothetical protein
MGRRGCERSVRLPEERDKPAALDVGQCALQDVGHVGEVLQARQTRPGDLRDDDVGRVRLALERDEIGVAIVCKTGTVRALEIPLDQEPWHFLTM